MAYTALSKMHEKVDVQQKVLNRVRERKGRMSEEGQR
jgi:hypothetical protein